MPDLRKKDAFQKMLIVSGFLGSGKTTFILQAAEQAVKSRIKTAVIVNEIGDIGVDNQFMRQMDLNVWEILGGCICCSLAGSLKSTLQEMNEKYRPDLIILEPSGAADLKNIDKDLSRINEEIPHELIKLTLVDPLRLDMMMAVITPLITSQIRSAHRVLINKLDAATEKQMDFARSTVLDIHPGAKPPMEISAKNKMDKHLFQELLP